MEISELNMTKDRPILTINRKPKRKLDSPNSDSDKPEAKKPEKPIFNKPNRPKFNKPRSRPQPNPETLELKKSINTLCRMFPRLFNYQSPKPLKVGILEDIFIVVGDRLPQSKSHYKRVLSYYTGTKRYLNSVLDSRHRYDLMGKPVAEITQEHKQAARDRLERLQVKKKKR
ncbi:ProQ/FinO family protein [Thiotrichales bacterium 19S3-7]|nr:ProQ/FinO family protein [Thiotrichales bacterium 19S3-7]MCF6801329.1 ProQ/FinO family protein [Thiotrichales bacterium 19S3-11]